MTKKTDQNFLASLTPYALGVRCPWIVPWKHCRFPKNLELEPKEDLHLAPFIWKTNLKNWGEKFLYNAIDLYIFYMYVYNILTLKLWPEFSK